MLISEQTLTDFGSAGRSLNPRVPAERLSTVNPISFPMIGANPSAMGERQMFPVQIINKFSMRVSLEENWKRGRNVPFLLLRSANGLLECTSKDELYRTLF